MAACAMRMRPSSHGPPPKPPRTGMLTARTTAAPAIGPELVKSMSEAPASCKSLPCSCRQFRRNLCSRRGLRAVRNAVSQRGLRRDAELCEHGDTGTHQRAHALWKIGGAVELNHVCATLLDQPYGGAHCALGPFLQRTVGKVATQDRARHATAHGFADHEHLVERDFERIGMAPQVHADRVSDGDDVDAGTVRDARDLIIP